MNQTAAIYSSTGRLYGTLIKYQDENVFLGEHWKCWMTDQDCLMQKAYFSILYLNPASNEVTWQKNKEPGVIFSGNSSITICCKFCIEENNSLPALTLKPGELFVLSPELWYCVQSADEKTSYFYMLSQAKEKSWLTTEKGGTKNEYL